MPSIHDIPRRIIRAKDPAAKKELDFGVDTRSNPFFSVGLWGMAKDKPAAQEIEAAEPEVALANTDEPESLDGKSSMNSLFSMFTKTVASAPVAQSTPLDESVVETKEVQQTEPVVVAEAVSESVIESAAPSQPIDVVVNTAKSGVAEQLTFDVIPAAPAVETPAETAEKPKGIKRIDSETAKKIRLVNKVLSFTSLFDAAQAPIPEQASAKQKKMPSADDARVALAELLGMKQKDGVDDILAVVAASQPLSVDADTTSPETPSI